MSLIFSSGCEYAFRALIHLTGQQTSDPTPIRRIAGHLDVPYPFLAKIIP